MFSPSWGLGPHDAGDLVVHPDYGAQYFSADECRTARISDCRLSQSGKATPSSVVLVHPQSAVRHSKNSTHELARSQVRATPFRSHEPAQTSPSRPRRSRPGSTRKTISPQCGVRPAAKTHRFTAHPEICTSRLSGSSAARVDKSIPSCPVIAVSDQATGGILHHAHDTTSVVAPASRR